MKQNRKVDTDSKRISLKRKTAESTIPSERKITLLCCSKEVECEDYFHQFRKTNPGKITQGGVPLTCPKCKKQNPYSLFKKAFEKAGCERLLRSIKQDFIFLSCCGEEADYYTYRDALLSSYKNRKPEKGSDLICPKCNKKVKYLDLETIIGKETLHKIYTSSVICQECNQPSPMAEGWEPCSENVCYFHKRCILNKIGTEITCKCNKRISEEQMERLRKSQQHNFTCFKCKAAKAPYLRQECGDFFCKGCFEKSKTDPGYLEIQHSLGTTGVYCEYCHDFSKSSKA